MRTLEGSKILGQEAAIRQLELALERGRLHHAYLFTGPEGVGKRTTARALAAALNCRETNPGDRPCGRCPSCLRARAGNHPGIRQIEPEKDAVRLHQVRQIQEELRFAPLAGERRAVIIAGADKLTLEAANALLKILEEPPAATIFIMVATDTTLIPATVSSRCCTVNFRPLPVHVVAELLAPEAENPLLMAALSGGSIRRARELVHAAEGLLAMREKVIGLWEKAGSGQPYTLEGEEGSLVELLDWLILWLRDLLVWRYGGPAKLVINSDLELRLARDTTNTDGLLVALEETLRAAGALADKANAQLVAGVWWQKLVWARQHRLNGGGKKCRR